MPYILIAIGAAAVLAACILIHLRKRKKEPSEPPVEEKREAGDFLEMFAKKHYMELDPTFTPKNIFNDFSGRFQGARNKLQLTLNALAFGAGANPAEPPNVVHHR